MTTQKQEDIIIPEEVQNIFDQADEEGPYAAKLLNDAVQLTSRDGKTVYKTVNWPDAARWRKNAMDIIARSSQEMVKVA